jgi:cytochrome c oxidase subunit 2
MEPRARIPSSAPRRVTAAGIVAVRGLLLALVVASPLHSSAADGTVVDLVAKRFEFIPSEITIAQGTPTLLRIRSQDVTHGFFNRDLGIDADIKPGVTTEVPVTPKAPGRYTVICDHFCGSGHGNMKMTIVVQ